MKIGYRVNLSRYTYQKNLATATTTSIFIKLDLRLARLFLQDLKEDIDLMDTVITKLK